MSMHVSDVDNLVSSSPPSVLRTHRPTSVPSLTRVLQHDTIHEYSLIEREEGILERRLDGATRCRLHGVTKVKRKPVIGGGLNRFTKYEEAFVSKQLSAHHRHSTTPITTGLLDRT